MPTYDFRCGRGHVTEQRQGYDVTSIPCRCGHDALRVGVYREQYMHAETGPRVGIKRPAHTRQRVHEFQEASAEIDHAYSAVERAGDPVKQPRYFSEAKREAKKRKAAG